MTPTGTAVEGKTEADSGYVIVRWEPSEKLTGLKIIPAGRRGMG